MSDVQTTTLEALGARRGLRLATSTNGLVAVKLSRIRKALNANLEASIEAIDAARQCAAKREGNALVGLPGKHFTDTLTPAFEIDPAKNDTLQLELVPIYTEALTLHVPKFTAMDAQWIRLSDDASEDECRAFGAALDLFTEKELAA